MIGLLINAISGWTLMSNLAVTKRRAVWAVMPATSLLASVAGLTHHGLWVLAHENPRYVRHQEAQARHITAYLRTGDLSEFDVHDPMDLPFPSAEGLAKI